MKVSLEESKSHTKEGRSEERLNKEGASSAPLPRQYSMLKANIAKTGSTALDVVVEFLQQALGEEENLEEVITNLFNVVTVGTSIRNELIANCMNSIHIQYYEKSLSWTMEQIRACWARAGKSLKYILPERLMCTVLTTRRR